MSSNNSNNNNSKNDKTSSLSMVGTTPQLYGRGNLRVCRRGPTSSKNCIILAALNRPTVRNAFNDEMYLDLIDLLHETASADDVAAIVLTGTGSYFCSGADLSAFQHQNNDDFVNSQSNERRNTLQKPAGRFMMTLIAYPKMICAAVQGPAVGIGVTLLLHCDLVHLSNAATLWIPFTRLALVPELCSSVVLRECMGLSKANELLLLGRKINAQTAYDWNLCSRIVPDLPSDDDDATTDSSSLLLDNPFHVNSLASRMVTEIQERLLSLPLSDQTVKYFCNMVKHHGGRREFLQQVCRNELVQLDERFHLGHVQMAARQIKIGKRSASHHGQQSQSRPQQQQQQQHPAKSKL